MSLLDKRILLVTGKGGTGKTTVAAALGVWAARNGKRTLICETNGTAHIGPLFRRPSAGYTPIQLHTRLHAMSITSEEAIEDYVVQQIKVRKLYQLVFRNRIMGPFMNAVPGLQDAVHLGKVFDLTRESDKDGRPAWDLVIIDAPATGHGLNMIAAPQSMMELTRSGPVFEANKLVDDVFSDPSCTGLVLTCLPEELPVNETLTLFERLGVRQTMVDAVVLNEMVPPQVVSSQAWQTARAALAEIDTPAVGEGLQMADLWCDKIQQQDQARAELGEAIDAPQALLPFLLDRSLGFNELSHLSTILEQQLEKP